MKASELIDKQIAALPDWRGELYTRLRELVMAVNSDIKEEWKWDTGVWSYNGMICAIGVFKDHVKINFFQGASLPDPHNIFNAGLEAKKTRAIDFQKSDKINEEAVKELLYAAVDQNKGGK